MKTTDLNKEQLQKTRNEPEFAQEGPKASPGWTTEVEVFELCGKSAVHDLRYYA